MAVGVLRHSLLDLDGTEFQDECTKIELVADQPSQTVRTLVPTGIITDVDSVSWQLNIEALSDVESGGLAAYLNANAGTEVAFEYAPRNTTGAVKYSGNVFVKAAGAGGSQGEFATLSVELMVNGAVTTGVIA